MEIIKQQHSQVNRHTMKTIKTNRLLKVSLLVICGSFAFVASSAWATLVTWNLNPGGLNQAVGSSSQSYTQPPGYTIIARGYDNSGGIGTAHELFFKNGGGDEIGLGLVNTPNNELQVASNGTPLQFIQLDLTSILAQGFTNFKIEIGSVQPGEQFDLYGSTTLGSLGIKLNSTPYGSSVDDQFVSVPNFGTYKFLSVVANAFDVLPVAFQATIVPIPEAASLIPAACLVVAVTAFEARRRRRARA
ncbi:MAG TPA: hypothetical protein VGQ95_04875 [Chthoniobacterales bacterium]|nr:hypothetical protein [Chthoniobacterales bacterium]